MDFFFKFAEAACGVVQVMLNGSLSEPFYKNRYFFPFFVSCLQGLVIAVIVSLLMGMAFLKRMCLLSSPEELSLKRAKILYSLKIFFFLG